jgi:hypothetical protein
MRTLVLVALLGCEQAKVTVAPPEPTPAPRPPGPQPLDAAVAEPPPVKTLPKQELEEAFAILDGKGTLDAGRLRSSPNLAVDPNWDPRRVWLVEWKQTGQSIALRGEATGMEDITQFTKRLAASVYFADVTPQSGERKPPIWMFEIRMRAPKADPAAPVLSETFTKPKP